MIYTSKTPEYESPNPSQGIFSNPYAVTGQPSKSMDREGNVTLLISFDLRYLKNGAEVIIERDMKEQFQEHQPTIILNAEGEPVDLREFLLEGGTYDKDRIVSWGRPSAMMMEAEYLDGSTLWTQNIKLTQNEPQRTIAKDWINANIKIQGQAIGENFELNE